MSEICFHKSIYSLERYFLCKFSGDFCDYKNIWITMKKILFLILVHFNKYCKSYLPTTCNSGFTYIEVKSSRPKFFAKELFWNLPILESFFKSMCMNDLSNYKSSA